MINYIHITCIIRIYDIYDIYSYDEVSESLLSSDSRSEILLLLTLNDFKLKILGKALFDLIIVEDPCFSASSSDNVFTRTSNLLLYVGNLVINFVIP